MKKKVYLSGKMSGLHPDIWRMFFLKQEITLKLEYPGIKVINPATTIIARHPWLYRIVGYRLTLWYDIQLLKTCDFICMVGDNWKKSRGARLERMKARKWNIRELK